MSDTHQSGAGTAATERYEALFRVSQTLISIRSSEELFRLLARELRAVVNFYVMGVGIYDEKAHEVRLNRSLLYKWRYRLEAPDAQVEGAVSTQNSRESRLRREVNKLKRLLADKTVEMDFFKGALQKVEARRQQSDMSGEKASTTKSEMPLQGSLSIERMCQLA